MKVKRFKNLWTMGLILMGAILVLFYIAKIFFPEWIVGVAEIPSIVKFGNFVQSNKWYDHIFGFITGYIHGYILYCACLRVKYLSWKGNVVLIGSSLILILLKEFYPLQYSTMNCACMVIMPFIVCVLEKSASKDLFVSTVVCFALELCFEFFSLAIRNLPTMTTQPNAVSMCILLIDLLIWRVILYLFFNNNKKGD